MVSGTASRAVASAVCSGISGDPSTPNLEHGIVITVGIAISITINIVKGKGSGGLIRLVTAVSSSQLGMMCERDMASDHTQYSDCHWCSLCSVRAVLSYRRFAVRGNASCRYNFYLYFELFDAF